MTTATHNTGNAGKGRPKGVPNKVTSAMREAALEAAADHGSDGKGHDGLKGYFAMLARDEKRVFGSILAKMMPAYVEANVNTADPLAQLLDQIATNGRRITDKPTAPKGGQEPASTATVN